MNPGGIDFMQVLMQYACLLFSLCMHEAAHAAMANYCGDPTARLLGRLTLDPRRHVDPFGTFLFPLIALTTGAPLIGWAKPVPVNPRNLHNMRRDQVFVALAGPGSNLLIALGSVFLLRIIILVAQFGGSAEAIAPIVSFFVMLITINVALAVFNMLPIPPLDGHYLLRYYLSPSAAQALDRIGPFGIIIAFVFAGKWMAVALPPVLSAFGHLLTIGL